MFAMNSSSVSIGYGSPADRVGDHHLQHAVRGERRLPRVRLVDAQRPAVRVEREVLGPHREAERRARQRRVGRARRIGRQLVRRDAASGYGARARKLPGPSSAPSSICSRCSARHVWKPFECAEMPRIAYIATGRPTHLVVRAAPHVGPRDRQLDRLRRTRRAPSRARCAGSSRPERRSARRPLPARSRRRGSARPRSRAPCAPAAVGSAMLAEQRRRRCRRRGRPAACRPVASTCGLSVARRAGTGRRRACRAPAITSHAAFVLRARNSKSIVPSVEQHVHQRQREQAIGARAHRQPFVGDGRVAGAHRIDRHELRAVALQLVEADLDRIATNGPRRRPTARSTWRDPSRARRTPRTSSRSV